MKKFFSKAKQHAGKFCGVVAGAVATVGTSIVALANDGTTNDAVEAAKTLMNQVAETINISNIVLIIGAGLGVCLGLYLAWWGVRKLVKMLKGALNGKLKL